MSQRIITLSLHQNTCLRCFSRSKQYLLRSVLTAGSRSLNARSKTPNLKSLCPKPIPSPEVSSSTGAIPRASRIVSVLGSIESMMPLHSAIASARLKSSIAVHSSCWSCLSQGLAMPL